jgi:hypothetical protein
MIHTELTFLAPLFNPDTVHCQNRIGRSIRLIGIILNDLVLIKPPIHNYIFFDLIVCLGSYLRDRGMPFMNIIIRLRQLTGSCKNDKDCLNEFRSVEYLSL